MRKWRFGLFWVPSDDLSLSFSAFSMCLEPKRGWLACGASSDRRVRVVSVLENGRTIFEANSRDNPGWPLGGQWTVTRVEFLADGKYLLAEYDFGGRGTSRSIEPTDIFETENWQKVWHENSQKVRAVTLSNDGKKLAFIRDGILEIGNFVHTRIGKRR